MKSLCWFSLDREGLDWRVGWCVVVAVVGGGRQSHHATHTHVWIVIVFFSPFLSATMCTPGWMCLCVFARMRWMCSAV